MSKRIAQFYDAQGGEILPPFIIFCMNDNPANEIDSIPLYKCNCLSAASEHVVKKQTRMP
jgi:hypothetical protein